MKIQILGTGCPKCAKLYEMAQAAATELGLDADFEKVQDINAIISMGVMLTPALVVDGKICACGRLPSAEELRKFLS